MAYDPAHHASPNRATQAPPVERAAAPDSSGVAVHVARGLLLHAALDDLDVLRRHRPHIWVPDREALELSLHAMLLRAMLGRLYWTFFAAPRSGESDGPDERAILLELAYTFLAAGGTGSATLPALEPTLPQLLTRVPEQALFSPFVEWAHRWRDRYAPEQQHARIAALPGLRWEACGLALHRPARARHAGRAEAGSQAVERYIYERKG